jgi:hypothetical protein
MELSREKVLRALDDHREALRRFGVTKIGLFGSVARGEATEASDLDFVVDFERYTFDDYMDTKFFLEDLFGRKVDLVIISDIKPILRPYIMAEVVYAPGY